MPRCTFCGIQIPKGTGMIFVYTSGKTANFCKSKCEKNFMNVKRKPLSVRWTEYYRKEHKKGQAPLSPPTESKKDQKIEKPVETEVVKKEVKEKPVASEKKSKE